MTSKPNTDPSGLVFNVQRFSLHDGPGIRTTIFMKGCPLRCVWCCNPESISPTPDIWVLSARCNRCGTCAKVCAQGAIRFTNEGIHIDRRKCNLCFQCVSACPTAAIEQVGAYLTVEEVVREAEKDRPFYGNSGGGVTLSGGEPLLQPEFTHALFKALKRRGLHTALDTSGYASWGAFSEITEYVDLLLYDLKSLNPEKHRKHTGVGNRLILSNIKKVTPKVKTWLRIPVIPGVNDLEAEIDSLAEFASKLPVEKVSLLPLHHWAQAKYARLGRPYSYGDEVRPGEEVIRNYQEALESHGLRVEVGG